MKSSASMYSSRENGTLRVPISAFCGLLAASSSSTWPSGIVRDDDLQRPQHRHHARRPLVEVVANRVFEPRHVDRAVELRHADPFAERAHRLGRVAAAAQAADRRHPRVVPAGDVLLLHELQQLALAHHRVGQVEPRELDLLRMVNLAALCRTSRTAAGGSRTPACRSSA